MQPYLIAAVIIGAGPEDYVFESTMNVDAVLNEVARPMARRVHPSMP